MVTSLAMSLRAGSMDGHGYLECLTLRALYIDTGKYSEKFKNKLHGFFSLLN